MSQSPQTSWQGQSHSVDQTLALGRAIGVHALAGDVIALIGDLGAGKTQLVRGLAQGLGCNPAAVASPTFVMVHEYPSARGRGRDGPVLVHIDAYRLKSLEDLESIGWVGTGAEMRQGAVVAVEWADRLGESLGRDCLEVRLAHAGDEQRVVVISAQGAWQPRQADLWAALDQAVREARACPICARLVSADAKTYPFCTERCRTIDLARWATGSYRISRPIEQSDLEEES